MAALDGLGLAYVFEEDVTDYLARGELVRVLEDWRAPLRGILPPLPEPASSAAGPSGAGRALR